MHIIKQMLEGGLRYMDDDAPGGVYEEVIEQADTGDETDVPAWDFQPSAPDPLEAIRAQMDELKSLIQSAKDEPGYDPNAYKGEIADEVLQKMAPMLDAMNRPQAIQNIVNTVADGLGVEAKAYIEKYFATQGYPASQIDHIRKNDKDTMTLLRAAAESVDSKAKKKPAPRSEGAQAGGDAVITSDMAKEINMNAQALSDAIGCSFAEAKAQLEKDYKEAKRAN